MEQILLRIPEAAQILGISKSYLYEICAKGELPVVRIGAATRIPATA